MPITLVPWGVIHSQKAGHYQYSHDPVTDVTIFSKPDAVTRMELLLYCRAMLVQKGLIKTNDRIKLYHMKTTAKRNDKPVEYLFSEPHDADLDGTIRDWGLKRAPMKWVTYRVQAGALSETEVDELDQDQQTLRDDLRNNMVTFLKGQPKCNPLKGGSYENYYDLVYEGLATVPSLKGVNIEKLSRLALTPSIMLKDVKGSEDQTDQGDDDDDDDDEEEEEEEEEAEAERGDGKQRKKKKKKKEEISDHAVRAKEIKRRNKLTPARRAADRAYYVTHRNQILKRQAEYVARTGYKRSKVSQKASDDKIVFSLAMRFSQLLVGAAKRNIKVTMTFTEYLVMVSYGKDVYSSRKLDWLKRRKAYFLDIMFPKTMKVYAIHTVLPCDITINWAKGEDWGPLAPAMIGCAIGYYQETGEVLFPKEAYDVVIANPASYKKYMERHRIWWLKNCGDDIDDCPPIGWSAEEHIEMMEESCYLIGVSGPNGRDKIDPSKAESYAHTEQTKPAYFLPNRWKGTMDEAPALALADDVSTENMDLVLKIVTSANKKHQDSSSVCINGEGGACGFTIKKAGEPVSTQEADERDLLFAQDKQELIKKTLQEAGVVLQRFPDGDVLASPLMALDRIARMAEISNPGGIVNIERNETLMDFVFGNQSRLNENCAAYKMRQEFFDGGALPRRIRWPVFQFPKAKITDFFPKVEEEERRIQANRLLMEMFEEEMFEEETNDGVSALAGPSGSHQDEDEDEEEEDY